MQFKDRDKSSRNLYANITSLSHFKGAAASASTSVEEATLNLGNVCLGQPAVATRKAVESHAAAAAADGEQGRSPPSPSGRPPPRRDFFPEGLQRLRLFALLSQLADGRDGAEAALVSHY